MTQSGGQCGEQIVPFYDHNVTIAYANIYLEIEAAQRILEIMYRIPTGSERPSAGT